MFIPFLDNISVTLTCINITIIIDCARNSTEWKPNCISYKQLPFNSPGILSGLFGDAFNQAVFNSSDENDKCPFCDEESVVCHTSKEVCLYTQYRRANVHGESLCNTLVCVSELCECFCATCNVHAYMCNPFYRSSAHT